MFRLPINSGISVSYTHLDVYKRQPLASVYVLSMGTDKLVGLDPAIISAAENSMLIKIAPEISEIESGFSQNGIMNAEELIKLDPDVVLYSSGVPEDYEIATQAGIPAVGFSLSIKDYNAVETINSWIELLEDVMGEDISSAEYVEYGLEMQEMIAERLSPRSSPGLLVCRFDVTVFCGKSDNRIEHHNAYISGD